MREPHRLEDKLRKLHHKLEQRNERVQKSPRCQPEAGPRNPQAWVARHKLTGQVELRLEGRTVALGRNQAAIDRAMELAGCYVVLKIAHEMERRLQARFGTTDTDAHATTLPDALAALSYSPFVRAT